MKGIVPFSNNDKVHRYANFIDAAYRKTQEANFKMLRDYYPLNTKFVVLPMDMKYMGAGDVKEDIDAQHAELARLAREPEYKDTIIPFAHIEPRRPNALARLQSLIENDNFKGVKIYPPLGYSPSHDVLMNDIYPYMVDHNIPLMAHCSPGSVNSRDISVEEAHAYADPDNYCVVMNKYPNLKICLAHFGGIDDWRNHINNPRSTGNPSWLTKIRNLMKSGEYPNLYTDISYTIFSFQENVSLLKVLLEDPSISNNVLFGSDFYMVKQEKYSEKRLSMDLRAALGETFFWKIACDNPVRYLN